jgi:hypothetical protein
MAKRKGKKENIPGLHVFVATPAYDGKVDTDYCQSIVQAAYALPLMGIKITLSCLANGAFIDLARNQFVQAFLDDHKECTHLFFVDADVAFPPDALIGLVGLNQPIVAGVYPKREPEEKYPVRWMEHPDGGLWCEDNFIMADRVPTGFLCIRRDVLEEMAADAIKLKVAGNDAPIPRVFYTDLIEDKDGNPGMIGEDFKFCDNYVAKYGIPIPVWPDIDFSHGGHKGNLAEHLNRTIGTMEESVEAHIEKEGFDINPVVDNTAYFEAEDTSAA